jgi:hypothetical protein
MYYAILSGVCREDWKGEAGLTFSQFVHQDGIVAIYSIRFPLNWL